MSPDTAYQVPVDMDVVGRSLGWLSSPPSVCGMSKFWVLGFRLWDLGSNGTAPVKVGSCCLAIPRP